MDLPAQLISEPRRAVPAAWRTDLCVMAVLLLLQLFYYTGIIASDDLGYLACARFGPAGSEGAMGNFRLRFTHWIPLAVSIRLLPGQAWAMAVTPLLAMALTLLVTRDLARRACRLTASWPAMALLGMVSVNVIIATVALPDITATALAWLGVALCAPVLLERDGRRAHLRCAAGGLLIAMGYNAKETAAVLIPSLCLFVLLYRTRHAWAWKRAALLAAGAALWVGAETAVLWCWTGDPLFHSHSVAEAERVFGPPGVERSWSGFLAHGADYLSWMIDPRCDYGPAGPLLLAGLLLALLRRKDPVCGMLACLVIPGLVYLSAGSSSLRAYQPLHHQSRYLIPLLPGMALAAAVAVEHLWRRGRLWRAPLAAVLFLAALVSLVAPNQLAGRYYYAACFRAGQKLLSEPGGFGDRRDVYASVLSSHRFRVPEEWLSGHRVVPITDPPTTAADWIARYAGQYVLTTRHDRTTPRKKAHAQRALHGPPLEALLRWPVVARVEPPRDRLSTALSVVFGGGIAENPSQAVEIRRIPPADLQASAVAAADPSAWSNSPSAAELGNHR